MRRRAEGKVHARDHHEGQSDRHEHLPKLAGRIDPAIERALQDGTKRRAEGRGSHKRSEEAYTPALNERESGVSTDHRKAAMRQIHYAHDAKCDAKSCRD